ncbi:uncharacterized protein LOC111107333 [Crassostrea virginica]|uniref:Uncharacterized protein LOC111107333 n=1 Tax=Crassostrea virginica TaxID=6565 RepID=A0A8B8B672_CRAVI|nr:uncharacterized protein LOC111107333 [Crassostrea virginica]
MARRSGVCEDTHFLVRYLCDDNLQVRSRAYFRCDSDVSISVGDEYDVQWGRPKDVDLAVVLFCGSEQEVRKRMQEMESLSEPLSPTPPQSPLSPSPPASPAPKRKKIPKSQEKSGKPRATVIAIGSPPDEAHGVHPPVTSQEALATPTIKETPTTSRTLVTAQTLGTPSTPSQNPTPVRFRAYRQSTGEDNVHSALTSIVTKMSEMQQTIDVLNKKVDAANRRSAAYEAFFKTIVGNTGNFAVNISRRLWPELFGEGDLRFQYNWYGGGIHNKKELDPVRKSVVRKYVCFFYPEVASEDAWRERIVSRINESLRRNDKRYRKDSVAPASPSVDIVIPAIEPVCEDDVFAFMD